MLSLLGLLIPGLLSTINGITNAIANERIAQLNAKTDQDRIESEERQKALEARRDVLVQEATNPASAKMNSLTRFLLALGPIAILLKLMVWDKVIGSFYGCANLPSSVIGCTTFNTDKLDTNQWAVVAAVTGFYFLYATFGKK
jgi:hypothetical protein